MNSILIVLLGAIGDVARAFCLLPPLKKKFPDLKITWLVEPKSAGLVQCHPLVDKVVVFDRKRGVRAVPSTWKELRAHQYDLVLDLQRHAKSGFFSWCSGAKRRIGFNRKDAKEFNWLWNTEEITPFGNQASKVDHYQQFLLPLDIPLPEQTEFGLRHTIESWVLPDIFPHNKPGYIGLVVGSSWSSKNWVPEGYEKLIHALAEKIPHQILLFGDASQVGVADGILVALSESDRARCTSLAGKTSLKELLAVIARCALVIGPDSGPGHLSTLTETPYVGFFGPTDPTRVAPYHARHLVIHSEIACAPCWRKTCPGLQSLCMRTLSVHDVVNMTLKGIHEKRASYK